MSGRGLFQYAQTSDAVQTSAYSDGRPILTFYGDNRSPEPVDARDFGAVGDGIHDDTSALNAALATGGLVQLQANSTYLTSGTLLLGVDGATLCGHGRSTVIKPISGANFDVISTPIPPSNGAAGYVHYYVGVCDLTIDCSQMTGTVAGQGNAIHFYGVRYGRLERLLITSCPNWAILLEGDTINNFGYNVAVRQIITDLGAASIYATGCEACTIETSIFKFATLATAAPQPAYGTQDTNALHMRLGSGYHYVAGNVFGNQGTYTSEALRLSNSGPCRIVGNRFDQVRYQAIVTQAGGHTIVGNQIGNPSSVGSNTAIQMGSSNNVVVGNRFDLTNGAAHFDYCCGEPSAQTGNVVADNQLVSGTAGFINFNAGSTGDIATHNTGYNPRGHNVAQPAVPASTTNQTNNTGVDCEVYITGGTVTAVTVGGVATGLTAGAFRVPVGQTIAITYSVAPTWQWYGD